MIELMDKYSIIKLKQQGDSNREVARMLGVNRKTVSKYWNEFVAQTELLSKTDSNIVEIQENIVAAPSYDSSKRKSRKYNGEIDQLLEEILENEVEKFKLLGTDKQKLTQVQIHQEIVEAGFDISLSTISNKIREKRQKPKECYIKQSYDLGDRLEYDYGEVN